MVAYLIPSVLSESKDSSDGQCKPVCKSTNLYFPWPSLQNGKYRDLGSVDSFTPKPDEVMPMYSKIITTMRLHQLRKVKRDLARLRELPHGTLRWYNHRERLHNPKRSPLKPRLDLPDQQTLHSHVSAYPK